MNLIVNIIVLVNTLIFFSLSSIHFYWIFGGRLGIEKAIPITEKGKLAFLPGKFATLIVAVGLLFFASVSFSFITVIDLWMELPFAIYAMWLIVVIFYLRAVGDFNLIGFFKKIKETDFANNDSKIYSPLCFYLASSSLFVLLVK